MLVTILQPGGRDKVSRKYNAHEVYVQMRDQIKEHGPIIGELRDDLYGGGTMIDIERISHQINSVELRDDLSIVADIELLPPIDEFRQLVHTLWDADKLGTSISATGIVNIVNKDGEVSDFVVEDVTIYTVHLTSKANLG